MIKYLINRPIAVSMIVLVIVVLSMTSLHNIPISLMPNINIPQITVQVDMPGYSVQEIEKKILAPLREQLSQIDGVNEIKSDARMDIGIIYLMFAHNSDVNMSFYSVNEKIDMAMGVMPKDMHRPKVMKAGAGDIPAFYIDMSLKREVPYQLCNNDFSKLSSLATDVIYKRLAQMPSVAMVDITGMSESEIVCTPDKNKMQILGLEEADFQRIIIENNIQLEALTVSDGEYKYHVHFDKQVHNLEDVKDCFLLHEGRIFQLKDLCDIGEYTTSKGIDRHNGRNCVSMAIIKKNDARMSELEEDISTILADLKEKYPEISFDITRDQTELLTYSLNNLKWNLLSAILITCVVLIIFHRNWRLALLVAISIPLSLLITLLCFYCIGISLNIISLSGLILGVGMIVDNSIIVVDNIIKFRREGNNMTEAVSQGVRDVFPSLVSSVLTTCGIFIPLIYIGGTAGALFYDQSIGITVALFSSLAISLIVVPVYYYLFFKNSKITYENDNYFQKKIQLWNYKATIWIFNHAKLCITLFIICIPSLIIVYFYIDKNQLPSINYSDGMMYVDWNENISASESDRRICRMLKKYNQSVETSTSITGIQNYMLAHTQDITNSEALIYLKCKSVSEYNDIKDSLGMYMLNYYPKAMIEFKPSGNLFDLMFSAHEPQLQICLQTMDGRRPTVEQTKKFVTQLRSSFPNIPFSSVATEEILQLVVNKRQMIANGITYSELRSFLEQQLGKQNVLQIEYGTKKIPVVLGNECKDRINVLKCCIKNKYDVPIPLHYLVTERIKTDYKHLYGNSHGPICPISLDIGDDDVKSIINFVNDYKNSHKDLNPILSGSYFSGKDTISKMLIILILSIILLFLIMAAEFESLFQPLIILSEIAIDIFVVLIVLLLLGEDLNMMSMIGLIVMSGIVINDSILKIDTINRLRREGMSLLESIHMSGQQRLIPIIMTSLTTIFSLIPFMSRGSIGADLQYPLSLVVIIGLFIGTFVSLYFVPLAYYLIYRNQLAK